MVYFYFITAVNRIRQQYCQLYIYHLLNKIILQPEDDLNI